MNRLAIISGTASQVTTRVLFMFVSIVLTFCTITLACGSVVDRTIAQIIKEIVQALQITVG